MTIGQKIKFIRTFKKIPQREIGGALGFAAHTTEIRMSQYENISTKTPKPEMLVRMAEIMTVSKFALIEKSGNEVVDIIMNAFWIEVDLYLYTQKNNIKNELQTANFLSSLITSDIKSNDPLVLAINEINNYKKMINDTNQEYSEFIRYMLTWADKSKIARQLLK